MKVRFFDTATDEDLMTVTGPDEFVMNVYNMFMLEMIGVHGNGFAKTGSGELNGMIAVDYTHNVRAIIDPQKGAIHG